MKYEIHHNQERQRFETQVDNLLCVLDYRLVGSELSIAHVGVPKPLAGRTIAAQLTQAALDWARIEKCRVIPICPYVQTWLRRHPEYLDLLKA